MKELSENVKAIDVVRQMVADGQVSKDVAEKYFPELKDSEDETIRKVLIQYFSTFRLGTFAYLEPKKIIAWLEKQGESDETKAKVFLINKGYPIDANGVFPTYEEMYNIIREGLEQQSEQILANSAKTCKDEQKPKFRIGDTIKKESTGDIVTISEIDLQNREYRLSNTGFIPFKYENLWELVEQKPADKVEHKRMTKLEDKLSSLVVNAVHIYCKENELDTPHYVGLILGDRLAKEWSQDILTLAKDELKMTEQKPAEWDNNDEYIFNTILHTLDLKKCKFEKEGNSEEAERRHTYYNWMKPLKNRILHQPQQEWSEEDEEIYQSIMDDTVQENQLSGKQTDWLRNIKYRHFPQPKQEWSEEDKRNLNWVINVWNRLRRGGDAQTTPSQMEYLENFLKSLKERYTWKPSDEQIGALEHFVRSIAESGFASPYDSNTKLVYSLFNDLKKLREEWL